jgi:hypothetical protein
MMMKLLASFLVLFFSLDIGAQSLNLPSFYISKLDSSSVGYYFFSPIKLGKTGASTLPIDLVLNKYGKVVYFKQYAEGRFSGGLQLQANGLLSYYFNEKFYLMDSTFKVVDSVNCKNGLKQDAHELLVLENGEFLMIGYEIIEMDLSNYNYFNKNKSAGSAKAKVKCDVVQALDRNKNVVFEWHGKDYYDFDDVDPYYLNSPNDVDWLHFNALEHDNDGNILVSVKNLNEITKVDKRTGKILWRLGGMKNQFTFLNDSNMFKGQHDIRRIKNGNITLFDNGYRSKPVHPEGAKEYKLNEQKLEAELVWQYINNPGIESEGYGSVQRLPNENTLINYGRNDNSEIIFNVVNPQGEKIFELASRDTLKNYRTHNYLKLPFACVQPKIKVETKNGQSFLFCEKDYDKYLWSNGQVQKKIPIFENGFYTLFVPCGNGGFIASEAVYIDIADLKSKK